MPTGAYDIDYFLDEKMKGLGRKIPENLKQLYLEVVKNSVGYNPRSLKRFINTFSLLNTIKQSEIESDLEKKSGNEELMLFALLGIQITYPKIFRYLGMSPDYKSWNSAFAAKNGLDWNYISEKVKEYGENELFDEDWEKVIWGICQSDAYLKSKVFSILDLLNSILVQFGDSLEENILASMEFAAITSVDDNHDSKQNIVKIGEKRIRYAGLDAKKQQLIVEWKANPVAIDLWYRIFSKIDQNLSRIGSKINYAKTATTFYRWLDGNKREDIQTIYCENPKGKYTFLNEFGWNLNLEDLGTGSKVDFENGASLVGPIANWKLAQYGSVWFGYEFVNSVSKEKSEALIIKINDKMLERLTE
jgi:hypothetical protein